MNLQDLAYIGDLIAAAGVVASLIYLSVQIQRSESTTRAATTQELLSKSIEILLSHDNNSPVIKAAAGEELSNMDKELLDRSHFALFSHFNNAYHQNLSGKLDQEIWDMYNARILKNVRKMQDFDIWWDKYKENFTETFHEYIESMCPAETNAPINTTEEN